MMDLRKKEPASEDTKENKKCCVDCKTTKTPLWRGGPAGPKSLCNACGIRYRKRRRIPMGRSERKRERAGATSTATSAKSVGGGGGDLRESVKKSLVALGKDLFLQRLPSVKKQRCQRRRKLLGEEEQAAVSLLALSCGSVFA